MRVSGRAVVRIGDLGPAKQTWFAAGAVRDLMKEESALTLEVGTKLWGGNVRVLGEVKEDPTIGLLFTIPF